MQTGLANSVSDSDGLKEAIQSRVKQMKEEESARKAEEKRIRLEKEETANVERRLREIELAKERELEEKKFNNLVVNTQEKLSAFYDQILPKVTEHFKSTANEMLVSADAYDVGRSYSNSSGVIERLFRVNGGKPKNLRLYGQLSKLGLGEGDSILLTDIWDEKFQNVMDPTLNWFSEVAKNWVMFRTDRTEFGRRHYLIGRLFDGKLRLQQYYKPGQNCSLNFWGWGNQIAIVMLHDQPGYIITSPEHHQIKYFIEEGELKQYEGARGNSFTIPSFTFPVVILGNRRRNFGKQYIGSGLRRIRSTKTGLWSTSRYAFYPDFMDKITQHCLKEFFSEHGLRFEAKDSNTFTLNIPSIR